MIKYFRRYLISGKMFSQRSVEDRPAKALWQTINDTTCLVIMFNGLFREEDAESLCRYLSKQISDMPETIKTPIVCNCVNMTDYEAKARLIFQNFLQKNFQRLQGLWIITQSPAIKGGAKLMSRFISLPIYVIDSEEKIFFR
ncbi:hypothetical protein [Rhodoflexus sp.]